MVHRCSHCEEEFASRNKLFGHIRDAHTVRGVGEGELPSAAREERVAYDLQEYSEVAVLQQDDEWYRAILKPQGLATMGSDSQDLLQHKVLLMPERFQYKVAYRKTIPCHRLDKLTGGIVLCSKSKHSETMIRLCFRHKLVQKRYQAIVAGNVAEDSGTFSAPIGGKEAITRYAVLDRTPSAQYGVITTLDLWPVTGRRHQLRRHLQGVGHSILGDKRYSHAAQWPSDIDRLFLWAVELRIPHPREVSTALHAMQVDVQQIETELMNYDSDDDNTASVATTAVMKLKDEQSESCDLSGDNGVENMIPTKRQRKLQQDPKPNSENGDTETGWDFVSTLRANLATAEQLHISLSPPRFYEQFRQNQRATVHTVPLS